MLFRLSSADKEREPHPARPKHNIEAEILEEEESARPARKRVVRRPYRNRGRVSDPRTTGHAGYYELAERAAPNCTTFNENFKLDLCVPSISTTCTVAETVAVPKIRREEQCISVPSVSCHASVSDGCNAYCIVSFCLTKYNVFDIRKITSLFLEVIRKKSSDLFDYDWRAVSF